MHSVINEQLETTIVQLQWRHTVHIVVLNLTLVSQPAFEQINYNCRHAAKITICSCTLNISTFSNFRFFYVWIFEKRRPLLFTLMLTWVFLSSLDLTNRVEKGMCLELKKRMCEKEPNIKCLQCKRLQKNWSFSEVCDVVPIAKILLWICMPLLLPKKL